MNITVIGATGQIGSQVVSILRAAGHHVVGAARSTGADVLTPKLSDTAPLTPNTEGLRPPQEEDTSPLSAAVGKGFEEDSVEGDQGKSQYFKEIFDEFVEVKMACGETVDGFTFDKFSKKLEKNTDQLLSRPGVKDVRFTVYVKDGKAALKAKVVRD